MNQCDLCGVNSKRIDMRNHCCVVRLLAGAPKKNRQAAYDRIRLEESAEAANKLIAEVNARRQAMNNNPGPPDATN